MNLSNLNRLEGIQRSKKRVGRGLGSGKGMHTTGKGNKGQKARSGNRKPWAGFEGGQVPLYKRLPQMRGFQVHGKIRPLVLNLRDLNSFADGTELTPKLMLKTGKIDRLTKAGVKILGNGDLEKKIILKGFTYSQSALAKIEKSGSKIIQVDAVAKEQA